MSLDIVLGSGPAGERAAGVRTNASLSAFSQRGIDPPILDYALRGRLSSLGLRARHGDPDAAAERDRRFAFERAVGDVLRKAFQHAGLDGQPATGRFRLPNPSPALAHALAGCDPEAVRTVFPDLGFPPALPASITRALDRPKTAAQQRRELVVALVRIGWSVARVADWVDMTPSGVRGVLRRAEAGRA